MCIFVILLQLGIMKAFVKWRHMQHFLRMKISEHKHTFDASNIRDFLDLYLASEQKQVPEGLKINTYLTHFITP